MKIKRARITHLATGLLALTLALSLVPLTGGSTLAASGTPVFINEIHYDNDSTDAGEAIEVAGPAGTDLSVWSLVLYNGNGGAVYNTTTLSGVIPDQQNGFGTLVFTYPSNGIQNGSPDGIALIGPSDAVAQFISYEGSFTAVGGPADGLTSTDIGVSEPSDTPVGESLQLTGTGAAYEDFTWSSPAANTFGAVNTGQTFSGGGPDYTPIYDIQYTTDISGDSPYKDQADVTTEGIVTARFQYGYFIEDPAGGAWNGLWVFDTSNTPALGDRVRLTGTVIEYYNLTELDALTDYQVVSSGNPLPDPLVVTTGAANDEQYESVLLRVENVHVTAEEDNYSEWEVNDDSGPLAVDNLGTDTYVPVLGDELVAIIGPLNFGYGAFKIAPRDDNDIILPGPDYTPIYDIQYTTDISGDSPYKDQADVTTEGIVTARFQYGYFIEDPAGGAWNGLWVFDTSNTPALGDRVRLTGTVIEYYNLTELDALTDYQVVSSGNPLPNPLVVTTGAANDEQYESVLLRVENVHVTAEEDSYSEWEVNDGSGPLAVDNLGTDTYVPALGDEIVAIIGPLNFGYGAFKIAPRDDNDIILPVPPSTFVINEVDSDTPSFDALEFVELYDGGTGNTALDGLVVVLFNGSDDASYDAFDLDGFSTDAEGYFVIGSVAEADLYVAPGSYGWLQNGADAVALYSGDAADFPNDTPITTDDLIDALVYDTSDGDDSGLLPLLNPGQPQVNEGGLGDKDNHSNQRCPNGEGGTRNTDTYTQDVPTPGAANCVVSVPLIINEVDSDTPSFDALEFVELYDGGTGSTALDGLVVVLFNGSNDASYDAFDLDGFSTDAEGYFVIGSVADADLYVAPGTYGWLQNGADAVALYSGDAADFPIDTPVTTDDLIDALVYDTNDSDDTGLLPLLNPDQPQVNEGGLGDKDNHSNQRCPNGEGGARNTDTYTQFTPTPGLPNCETPEVCGDLFTPVYEVQGSSYASPIVGSVVSVEGVVTGDLQGADELDGFFIQDATGDGNDATSDGIFVYAPGAADVMVGEHVRVRGTVSEYYELTEIGYVDLLLSCGTGSVGATSIDLPVSVDLEPYEGMLVTFPEDLTASQNYFQGRYGQVTLSSEGRLFNPTNIYAPSSPEAIALADENMRRMVVLDDGMDVEPYGDNPAPIPYIGADNTLRAGDTVAGLTGVIDYGQITAPPDALYHYRLHPTEEPVSFTRVNERTAAPEDVGGVTKIASFNVLNYFNGDGMGGGFPTSRGASSPEEFTRQRDKIISAIVAMDADAIGLMEIENDGYDQYSAIADLVNGLNDATGPGTYAFIDPGVAPVGTDEIAVGFIYQPAAVTPVGATAILDSSVDPSFRSDYNRPAIAQTFERSTGGGRFTAVVNHLKSKGSPCDDIGDPDTGDGQGNCNLTRKDAAIALTNWLVGDPTGSDDPDFFIIGDLNSYAMEDPITAIKNAGYTNLVDAFVGTWAYSYIFDGQAGYLDHALASPNAFTQVSGATVWHINTDEPSVIDYNTDYKPQDLYTPTPYRSSDHDPVIVGFCDAVPPTLEVSVTPNTLWPPNHKYVTVNATVNASDSVDPNPTLTLVSVTSNEPDDGLDDGGTVDDILIVDDFTFKLRAERSGTGEGRIYTITYQATDACGNTTVATATVTVPLSEG